MALDPGPPQRGRFTIQLKEVKDNVAIDDSKFAKPDGNMK